MEQIISYKKKNSIIAFIIFVLNIIKPRIFGKLIPIVLSKLNTVWRERDNPGDPCYFSTLHVTNMVSTITTSGVDFVVHKYVLGYLLSFFEMVTGNSSGCLLLPKSFEPKPKTCGRCHYYGLGFYTVKASAGFYTCGFCKP